jgi:hypothetical protein
MFHPLQVVLGTDFLLKKHNPSFLFLELHGDIISSHCRVHSNKVASHESRRDDDENAETRDVGKSWVSEKSIPRKGSESSLQKYARNNSSINES